jgi:cytoskeletal protein CcmA (bactofilin family)
MGILKGDSTTSTTGVPSVGTGGFNAILDRGSEFEGKLTFEGTVRIDGKFKGEIFSDANLVIGESGKLEANIQVGSVSVSGEIRGNITAKTKVEIHPPAVVHGNIQTPSLLIEEGAIFEGNCVMEKTTSTNPKISKAKLEPPTFTATN